MPKEAQTGLKQDKPSPKRENYSKRELLKGIIWPPRIDENNILAGRREGNVILRYTGLPGTGGWMGSWG
jgi:hypothetical protein